jgi:hypothetical protein
MKHPVFKALVFWDVTQFSPADGASVSQENMTLFSWLKMEAVCSSVMVVIA